MNYGITGLKTFRGMEGRGYNATLCRDGAKVALLIDGGNGGMLDVEWADHAKPRVGAKIKRHDGSEAILKCTPEEALLRNFLWGKTYTFDGHVMDQDIESFCGELIDAFTNERRFRRMCIKKVLFRLKGDKGGEYRVINQVFSQPLHAAMVKKYGDKIDVILNVKYGVPK